MKLKQMILGGLSLLMLHSCDDAPVSTICNVTASELQQKNFKNDLSPKAPDTLVTDLKLSGTYEGSFDEETGAFSSERDIVLMEADFQMDHKDSHIEIYYDQSISSVIKIEFNYDLNNLDPFSCVEDSCNGVTIDAENINVTLDNTILANQNQIQTEAVSGTFTMETFEAPIESYSYGCD